MKNSISHQDLMLATPAPAPFSKEGWLFEVKMDGFRVLAMNIDGEPRLISRNGIEMSAVFPELTAELKTLPEVILDGELVVLDDEGAPDIEKLQRRSRMRVPKIIAHAAKTTPAAIFAFDLLRLRGNDIRHLPLIERKALLRNLLRAGPIKAGQPKPGRVLYTQHVETDGTSLYAAIENKLEGIIAKKADARYTRGRSRAWLKVKTKVGKAREAVRLKHPRER